MMKKLLITALLAFSALSGNAQVTMVYNGKTLGENDTVTVIASGDEAKFSPIIKNNGANDINAQIWVQTLHSDGMQITSVCTGLECMADSASAEFTLAANGEYSSAYIDFYVPENAQRSLYNVKVVDFSTSNALCETTVKIKGHNAGICQATGNNSFAAFPNPASTSCAIDYTLDQTSHATLYIFNTLGVTVQTHNLSSTGGSIFINTSNLPNGIYYYTISDGIRPHEAKKLIIRR